MDEHLLIEFDGLPILLPQYSVRSIDIIDDVQLNTDDVPGRIGEVPFQHGVYPVFSLSAGFERQSHLPSQRKLCVILRGNDTLYGLVCDRIERVVQTTLPSPQTLPACLCLTALSPPSPLESWFIYADKPTYQMDSERLATYLQVGEGEWN